MISILDSDKCTGCLLCIDVCPKEAIIRKVDDKTGFQFPVIDISKCIDCGICSNLCPSINQFHKTNEVRSVYAINNKNIETRFESTSGGIFTLLANEVLKNNGYVVGAIWKNQYEVIHYVTNHKEELSLLKQSKYIESNPSGIYKQIKGLLKSGSEVFFVGCPCQVSALKAYIKDDMNLYTADLICKGIPSPLIWKSYIEYIEKNFNKKIKSYRWKDKEYGWKRLGVRLDFTDSTVEYIAGINDNFSILYSKNYILRESCYNCQYRGLSRLGDLTLGDCWGVETLAPQLDDDCGTSIVLVNSNKGMELIDKIREECYLIELEKDGLEEYNKGLSMNPLISSNDRNLFWDDFSYNGFQYIISKYCVTKKKLKQRIRPYLSLCREVLHITQMRPKPLWQFFYLNFFSKHIKTDVKNCGVLIPSTYCVFQFEKNAEIELHGKMIIGPSRVKYSKRESRLLMKENSKIIVNSSCYIQEGADIEIHKNGKWIMDEFHSNFNLEISCGELIEMHGYVGCGRKVTIRDYNGHIIAKNGFQIANPIKIENHTWLCSGCTIMPGVHIQTGAVVSANAYVASNVPPYTLVAGKTAVIMAKDVKHKI